MSLIPGDGIGNELAASVKQIFKVSNLPVDWEEIPISGYKEDQGQVKLAIDSIKRNKVGLKGSRKLTVSYTFQNSLK